MAREKRASFAAEDYWGRPVPGFGDPLARVYVLGLAPAAHGGNRTGRVFTGDRSGDWLFASMHRCGLASQPTSTHPGDGLRLHGAFAWTAALTTPAVLGAPAPRPRPAFGHAAEHDAGGRTLLGCFHPSQQNTFTGKLTAAMMDDVLGRARALMAAPR